MRDPARIDRMIERLRDLWHANPDMRLGQLLVNVIRPGEPCPRMFYAEDTDTEKKLAEYPHPEGDQSPDSQVTIGLTKAEALVLFVFLMRFRDKDVLKIEHSAEVQILWDTCALLQNQVGHYLLGDEWLREVEEARNYVNDMSHE